MLSTPSPTLSDSILFLILFRIVRILFINAIKDTGKKTIKQFIIQDKLKQVEKQEKCLFQGKKTEDPPPSLKQMF